MSSRSLPLLALLLVGCATRIGARSLPDVRAHYNESVARSSAEQMLLNLVRLRYSHQIQFLEPVSVVTSYSFTRSAGLSGSANLNGENSFSPIAGGGVSANVGATETPTITYSPLSGEEFVRRLVAPLPPDLLMLLVQGGWPIDFVFPVAVSRIGDARAPTIAAKADDSRFVAIIERLTELQQAGAIEVEVGGESGPMLAFDPDGQGGAQLQRLLGTTDRTVLTLRGPTVSRDEDELAFLTRSMLDLLFYLSHGVEVPPDDPTARDLGVPLPVAAPLLRVQSGDARPNGAYVAVPYRQRWYWIADDDRASKRVFSMLSVLFAVMSAPTEAATPVLTLPR